MFLVLSEANLHNGMKFQNHVRNTYRDIAFSYKSIILKAIKYRILETK